MAHGEGGPEMKKELRVVFHTEAIGNSETASVVANSALPGLARQMRCLSGYASIAGYPSMTYNQLCSL
jgi:hypothetical protein